MKTKTVFTAVFLIADVAAIAFAQNQFHDFFSIALSPAQQRQCGLHKLATSERSSLARLFSSVIQSSALCESSVEYLKNEGWEEVKVLGERTIKIDEDSDPEEYVIAEKGTWTYILEPKTFSSLSPGIYLGKMSFTSCEIIDSDGDTVGFWTEDTR